MGQEIQPQPADDNNIQSQLLNQDAVQRDSNAKVILVAEDNLVNQKIATLLLEKLGLVAQVVRNGLEAVQAVAEKDYPVVLMDCNMPEMDGFEATKAIRRMEKDIKHTPIIAVTALAMAGDRERCIECGMDDYIAKPIDKERLKNKLNLWMKKEFVFHNQKLAERFFELAAPVLPLYHSEPIDIAELEVFYGSREEVSEVLMLFVTTTEKHLPELELAIKEHRATLAGRMSHELKGASASVGAKEMSILCLQLEQEVGQQYWREAAKTEETIHRCFDSVKAFVSRNFHASDARTVQS